MRHGKFFSDKVKIIIISLIVKTHLDLWLVKPSTTVTWRQNIGAIIINLQPVTYFKAVFIRDNAVPLLVGEKN